MPPSVLSIHVALPRETRSGDEVIRTAFYVRVLEEGLQSTDQRHVFNLSAVAQVPAFSNNILRRLVSDWQLSPILKVK